MLKAISVSCRRQFVSRRKLTGAILGRATEMDITMIGLQNAGKTSLLRVLAVRTCESDLVSVFADGSFQGGEFTIE